MITQSIRRIPIVLAALALLGALFASPAAAEPDMARYVVILKDSVEHPGSVARSQTEQRDGRLGFVYRHALKGYSAVLPKSAVDGLRRNPLVELVAPDRRVETLAQTIPTGIDRTFASASEELQIDEEENVRVDADIAIIDTGISLSHPDLDLVGRTNCAAGEPTSEECVDNSGSDGDGHGTHVAGTAAAIDNGVGVVGVAPGARLWAVKVLNDEGFGYDSWIAAGVDWVTATRQDEDPENDIEVANMSLGCECSLPLTSAAIKGSVEEGVVYTVAAGNSGANAQSHAPANHSDVITVSALADFDGQPGAKAGSTQCRESYESKWGVHKDDSLAVFSNWGATVEVAAPGVCIRSTVPGGGYAELGWWGTSMASPHVAGAAAILAAQDEPESKAEVEAIRDAIVAAGNLSWEDNSGDEVQEPLLDVGNLLGEWMIHITANSGSNPSLRDVSCVSTSECIAVGRTNGSNPHAQRWDGKKWSALTIGGGQLTDVSCATATFCIALRESGLTTVRWDGSKWTSVNAASPAEAVAPELRGLSCATTTSCITVGRYALSGGKTRTLAESWNGEKWAILTTPFEEGGSNELNAVSCTSSTSCTAIGLLGGKAAALRWNGSEWSTLAAPKAASNSNADIYCTAANACTALIGASAVAERWNGSEWSSATLPTPEGGSGPKLYGVSCASAIACTAVGKYTSGSKTITLAERWNGSAWSVQATPNPTQALQGAALEAVSCPIPSRCTAVGYYQPGVSELRTLAERYTGKVPVGTTKAATEVTGSKAKLNATVDPDGVQTSYQFEYGKTTAYGTKAPASPKSVGSGTEPVEVSEAIEGLEAGTTYHFRVVATSAAETSYGQDMEFATQSPPTATTNAATGVTHKAATLNATVNPKGLATTYQFEYGKTAAYGTKVPASPKSAGSGSSPVAVNEAIEGLQANTTYHFRVVATSSAGTSHGSDLEFTTEVEPSITFSFAFGKFGTGNGQFNYPFDIAIDSEGDVWVADSENERVQQFNSKGEYLSKFGVAGTGNGQLDRPTGIAIDSQGDVWVADHYNNRVQQFKPNGEYLSKFGTKGSGNGQFSQPMGVAIDSEGDVWVTDTGNNRVQQFKPNGEFLTKFGTSGTGNGQLSGPVGIAIDTEGDVWVVDSANNRVQQFKSNGEYLSQFGTKGAGNGQFNYPTYLAIDSTGNLWVADFGNARVQRIKANGEYLDKFGAQGSGEGQFLGAMGIAIDSAKGVWVSDAGGNRVQKWLFK